MEQNLEEYLHTHIPLSKAMDLKVVLVSPQRVVLRGPLAPNVNHKGTAFGGSLQAAALLACWSLAREVLRAAGAKDFAIVVKESAMKFRRPVESFFESSAEIRAADAERFAKDFLVGGKSRLVGEARIECNGVSCAVLTGTFVALKAKG